MTEQNETENKPLSKAQLKQGMTSLKDIKIISDSAKDLIIKLENEFKNNAIELDLNDSAILINGYLGKAKNHRSFMYSLARVLSALGYIKTMTREKQTLVNDIKRIGYDIDKKIISLDFRHKDLTIDDYIKTLEVKN